METLPLRIHKEGGTQSSFREPESEKGDISVFREPQSEGRHLPTQGSSLRGNTALLLKNHSLRGRFGSPSGCPTLSRNNTDFKELQSVERYSSALKDPSEGEILSSIRERKYEVRHNLVFKEPQNEGRHSLAFREPH